MTGIIKVDTIQNNGGTTGRTIDSSGFVSTGKASAFSAYANSDLSVSNTTHTIIQYNVENFDTQGWYDTSTYKFTPQIAGYYWLEARLRWNTATDFDISDLTLRVNGSVRSSCSWRNERYETGIASAVVYMNGSTDYAQGSIYQDTGSSHAYRGQNYETMFQGFRILG